MEDVFERFNDLKDVKRNEIKEYRKTSHIHILTVFTLFVSLLGIGLFLEMGKDIYTGASFAVTLISLFGAKYFLNKKREMNVGKEDYVYLKICDAIECYQRGDTDGTQNELKTVKEKFEDAFPENGEDYYDYVRLLKKSDDVERALDNSFEEFIFQLSKEFEFKLDTSSEEVKKSVKEVLKEEPSYLNILRSPIEEIEISEKERRILILYAIGILTVIYTFFELNHKLASVLAILVVGVLDIWLRRS